MKININQFRVVDHNKIKQLEEELTPQMKFNFMASADKICEGYKIDSELKEDLNDLCKYFLGIEGKLTLKKGIFLSGTYGAGKSTLMMVIRQWLADYWKESGNGFMVTSIEEIIQTYKTTNSLDKFVNNSDDPYRSGARHLLINEFGGEMNDKIYGVESQQILDSLMKMRYDLFQQKKKLTHCTSNFAPSSNNMALLDRYIEMFNVIEIKTKSQRK